MEHHGSPSPRAERGSERRLRLNAPRGRRLKENLIYGVFLLSGSAAIIITLLTAGTFVVRSIPFFQEVSVWEFIASADWNPISDFSPDFGALALMSNTLVITAIAVAVALPLALLISVLISEYLSRHTRQWVKPILEILAGIPTVVYGFFALQVITPFLQETVWPDLGYNNGISAGLIMGVMIIPLAASIIEDVLYAIPRSLREGALAMGATKFETVWKILLPAGISGIGAAFILSMSRAIGETMIVTMAAGMQPAWPPDPSGTMMTMTSSIVNIATGGEHAMTDFIWGAVFAIGLYLFVVTLVLNVISHLIVERYREQYE